ncbi:MAG: tetratricopeptide repeat protein [Anaerolineae bacterium]|nr:tetratricopeptide repeat protein [Anaerolineae bacterium]
MTHDLQAQIAEQEQALSLAQQNNDPKTQLEICDKLGHLYRDSRNYDDSVRYYQQAAAIASQLKDANFLFRIGISLSVLHQYPQSLECLKQAIEISLADAATEGNAPHIIHFLANQYRHFLGDIPQAITYYQQALEIARKTGDIDNQLHNLRELGDSYKEMNQYKEALDYYILALELARRENNLTEQAAMLTNMAYLYSQMGDQEKAEAHFELALSVAQASGGISEQISVFIWWGHAYRNYDDLWESSRYYQRGLTLAQADNDITHISSCLGLLAQIAQKQGKLQEAVDLYQQEFRILHTDRLKSPNQHRNGFLHFSYTHALESLGGLHEELGDIPQALSYLEQALASTTLRASVQDLNEQITRLRQKLNPNEAITKS